VPTESISERIEFLAYLVSMSSDVAANSPLHSTTRDGGEFGVMFW
jgi:copper(I)-binding protein